VIFVGIAFAALREASPVWDGALLSMATGALLVSILLAIHCSRVKRAFWLGFALFGTAYLGLTIIPSIDSRLITTQALAFLDSRVPGRPEVVVGQTWGTSSNTSPIVFQSIGSGGGFVATGSQGTSLVPPGPVAGSAGPWRGTTENFIRIGQSLLVLVVAWIGGLFSRLLYVRAGHDA
jgi:hypothetical protein